MIILSKMQVAVLFGGVSSEHEVSRVSAGYVVRELDRALYTVHTVGITKDGRWLYYTGDDKSMADGSWEQDPHNVPCVLSPDRNTHGLLILYPDHTETVRLDVVFPVLHGKNGEDGTMQGLLQLSGIPFVGCRALSSAVCMDKAVTHSLLEAARIEQAHYLWFYADLYHTRADVIKNKIAARLDFPVFVKPANAGSSVGISKVNSIDELDAAVEKAAKEDGKIVVEEGIVGAEVECAVMGNEEPIASTVGEIGASAEFYDYDDKYKNGTSQLYIPARLPEEKIEEIRAIAKRAYHMLGCRGLARVDFFVREKDGRVLLNEINTLPGFTAISMYPKLWEHEGVSGTELLNRLIAYALAV